MLQGCPKIFYGTQGSNAQRISVAWHKLNAFYTEEVGRVVGVMRTGKVHPVPVLAVAMIVACEGNDYASQDLDVAIAIDCVAALNNTHL